ncbi:MFS transporter [Meiothermus granaticius]|uniref:Riboflavin transporter RfnT n=1 Tax=Meiothermus granaticius NBRC 107808 TaxID=1227551 RepID=A0A399FB58_9DEIN|nr:MFS transporter [Meiothermus granaticius]RIH91901.1 Riboflavin transporter RfnT [Meiothermus granaticius NBRC 107808]GEM85479.1 MFS transporter [Meiothermus granaticius NBRC 107808]
MSTLPAHAQPDEVPIPILIKKNTLLLAITQAITGAGTQLVPALGAIQVVALLGNATFAGLTTSLMGLARMAIAYPVGRLTDARGRKVGVFLGLWLALVGSLTVGLATLMGSFALFCVGILLFGGGVGAIQQMRVAAADMYPPSKRAEGMSLILMGSLFGAGISPAVVGIAGRLANRWNLNDIALAWLLVPVLVLPCFLLIASIRPDPKSIGQNLGAYYPAWALGLRAELNGSLERSGQGRIRSTAILAAVAVQGQMSMLMAMTALALKRQDCSLPLISLSVAIHVIGMFALSWPIGRLADRLGRKPTALLGLGVSALGALLVGLGHTYLLITSGTFLVGIGWAGAYLSANTMLTDITPTAQRGQAVGVLELWSNLAGMALPLLGGLVVGQFGLSVLGFFGVGVTLLPVLAMARVREVTPGSYT